MTDVDFWNLTCKYCGKPPEPYKFIPQTCSCEEAQEAEKARLEEIRNQSDYTPPPTKEEFDKAYPLVYKGERLVVLDGDAHKLLVEARQWPHGEGVTVKIPFDYENEEGKVQEAAGFCFDCTEYDAAALYELLGEYLEEKK